MTIVKTEDISHTRTCVTNADEWERIRQEYVSNVIRKSRLRWFGHIRWMSERRDVARINRRQRQVKRSIETPNKVDRQHWQRSTVNMTVATRGDKRKKLDGLQVLIVDSKRWKDYSCILGWEEALGMIAWPDLNWLVRVYTNIYSLYNSGKANTTNYNNLFKPIKLRSDFYFFIIFINCSAQKNSYNSL